MKVVCISIPDYTSDTFTVGKIYESIIIGNGHNPLHHFIINDNGDIQWMDSSYFITLYEHRMNQLKKLGI